MIGIAIEVLAYVFIVVGTLGLCRRWRRQDALFFAERGESARQGELAQWNRRAYRVQAHTRPASPFQPVIVRTD